MSVGGCVGVYGCVWRSVLQKEHVLSWDIDFDYSFV